MKMFHDPGIGRQGRKCCKKNMRKWDEREIIVEFRVWSCFISHLLSASTLSFPWSKHCSYCTDEHTGSERLILLPKVDSPKADSPATMQLSQQGNEGWPCPSFHHIMGVACHGDHLPDVQMFWNIDLYEEKFPCISVHHSSAWSFAWLSVGFMQFLPSMGYIHSWIHSFGECVLGALSGSCSAAVNGITQAPGLLGLSNLRVMSILANSG